MDICAFCSLRRLSEGAAKPCFRVVRGRRGRRGEPRPRRLADGCRLATTATPCVGNTTSLAPFEASPHGVTPKRQCRRAGSSRRVPGREVRRRGPAGTRSDPPARQLFLTAAPSPTTRAASSPHPALAEAALTPSRSRRWLAIYSQGCDLRGRMRLVRIIRPLIKPSAAAERCPIKYSPKAAGHLKYRKLRPRNQSGEHILNPNPRKHPLQSDAVLLGELSTGESRT